MTARKTESRLRSLFCSIAASCMFLLVVSLVWLSAEGAASGSESSPVSFWNRDRQGDVELPGGMEPMDVVRMVQENRYPGAHDLPLLSPSQTAEELRPPFHIGGNPQYGAAASEQRCPAVAFDGSSYLVVWHDNRGGTWDIYGARVNLSATVLDLAGIRISTGSSDEQNPAVAFDGVNYLVVWQDNGSGLGWDTYGARVSVSGAVLDPEGIAISTVINDQTVPAVAFGGVNYLVVWQDGRSGSSNDIYCGRVDQSGNVLDGSGLAVSTAPNDQSYPSAGFGGTSYLAVWQDRRSGSSNDVYGARVNQSGTVLDTGGIEISAAVNDQSCPSVVFGGSSYMVVWQDNRSGSDDVYATAVDPAGTVLDTSGIAVCTAVNDQLCPAVAFDGTNFVTVWYDHRNSTSNPDIYGARLSTTGTVLDGGGIAISMGEDLTYSPAVAFGGMNYLVVWGRERSGYTPDIYGARVTPSANVLEPGGVLISKSTNSQDEPAVAFNGANYLVVWLDNRVGIWKIFAARVDTCGAVLDPGGIEIFPAQANSASYPAAASDGSNYLVVWGDNRGPVYATRIGASGNVLDVSGINIGSGGYPNVAFDGTNYLVVWDLCQGFMCSTGIYGRHVSTSGVVIEPSPIVIFYQYGSIHGYSPDVACGRTNCLVAWTLLYYSDGWRYAINAALVDSGGVLDPPGRKTVSSGGNVRSQAAVASGCDKYLVVWHDNRNGSYDIYGARVDTSGVVFDPTGIPISTAGNNQRYPDIAFGGTEYLVTWHDMRSSSWDIYGARIDTYGTVLDPDGMRFTTAIDYELYPSICTGTPEQFLITYSSFTPPPIYGSYRIWGNIWGDQITGMTFTSASATPQNGYVTLLWRTGVDVSAASFLVQRSDSPEGTFVTLDLPISRGPGLSFTCTDYSVQAGKTYWYKIVLAGPSGEESYGPIEVHVDALPVAYQAYQGYPNPFNPLCTIRYDIPRAGRVSLRVFDVNGSLVRTLVSAWREPGVYSEVWDGRDDSGKQLPSGVYFYRLEAGDFVATHKLVLLR